MKPASIEAYEKIKGQLPTLLYMTLCVIDRRVTATGSEAHEDISSFRAKTAYSSVRSRFWELEIMGLILGSGERVIRLGNGKTRIHTAYRLTPNGHHFLSLEPVVAKSKLTEAMSIINKGRNTRRAAVAEVWSEHNQAMSKACRAKLGGLDQ